MCMKFLLVTVCLCVTYAYVHLDENYIRANAKSMEPAPTPKKKLSSMLKLGIKPKIMKKLAGAKKKATVHRGNVDDKMFQPMGRLIYFDDFGKLYYCSGQYVAPNLLLTAAHCVHNSNKRRVKAGWNRNISFVQNYDGDPNDPSNFKGTIRRVEKAIVDKKYYSVDGVPVKEGKEQMTYDFAFISMYDPTISTFYEIDSAPYSKWTTAGYPSNYARGHKLHWYSARQGQSTYDLFSSANDPMGEGCSGGAWLVNTGGRYKLIGINSFTLGESDEMFSPRLLPEFVDPVRLTANKVLQKLQSRCQKKNPDYLED